MDVTTGQLIQLAAVLITGLAGKRYLDRWTEVKKYIHETRKVFDAIDNALYDDTVDETSFRETYETRKNTLVK